MPEYKAAINKVMERIRDVLLAHPDLMTHKIVCDHDPAEAVEAATIVIYTTSYRQDQSDEMNQTRHTATIEFECVGGPSEFASVAPENQRFIAYIIRALAEDRTLGQMVEDIQEMDVAPVGRNGRDMAATSLQTQVDFYTSRDDWFTIIGGGGLTF